MIVRSVRAEEIAAGVDVDGEIAVLIARIGMRVRRTHGRQIRGRQIHDRRIHDRRIHDRLGKVELSRGGLLKDAQRAGVIVAGIVVVIGSGRPCRRSATC